MTAGHLTVACVQVNAGPEIGPNLETAGTMVRRARETGAELIALPENAVMVVQGRARVLERSRPEDSHPAVSFFRDLASETGAWLLVGSLAVLVEDGRAANRSYLIDPQGTVRARYDKMHMFDVDLANGESYRESSTFRPGDAPVLAETPWGGL
ncbi:MAG TPA: nitrilase-related carbon-nitrogen hydrolase, partial [Arenibaculum sp.]|nr:nitrilase-related carbon-nitrogen hydrolase [Arenibaculum sp.]